MKKGTIGLGWLVLSLLLAVGCGTEREPEVAGVTLRPEVVELLSARQARLTGRVIQNPSRIVDVEKRQNVLRIGPNVEAAINKQKLVDGVNLPNPQHLGASSFTNSVINAPSTSAFFGQQSVTGDFNCDGHSDIAVAQDGYTGTYGRILLFFGSTSGPASTYSYQVVGTVAQAKFGFTLAALQFDGDASDCTDLAVHAYADDSSRGRVFMYLGRSTWTDRTDFTAGTGADLYFTLNVLTAGANERLGWGLAGADVNGDGYDDMVFSHFNATSGGFAQVLVVYGRSGVPTMSGNSSPKPITLPGGADLLITGGDYDNSFGQFIANGGALDSSTGEEILISAFTDSPPNYNGAIYVVEGASDTVGGSPTTLAIGSSSRVNKISGTSATTGFGFEVGGIGDFNDDGTTEFVVSEPYHTAGGNSSMGKAYIFEFDTSPIPSDETDAVATISNNNTSPASDLFSRGLANGTNIHTSAGCDLDSDGYSDIVLSSNNTGSGNYGSVYVWLGSPGTLSNLTTSGADYTWNGATGETSFGLNNNFALDANNDTYPDLIISEPYYSSNTGRIWYYR